MSSKEQYREALKRANATIRQWKEDFDGLTKELKKANQGITQLEIELNKYHRNSKKWWEFWK